MKRIDLKDICDKVCPETSEDQREGCRECSVCRLVIEEVNEKIDSSNFAGTRGVSLSGCCPAVGLKSDLDGKEVLFDEYGHDTGGHS